MLHEFEYAKPGSAAELYSLMAKFNEGGMILAGGTDLLPNIRNGTRKPLAVIDIKKLPGADSLEYREGQGLSIGPAVTINDILRSEKVRSLYPVLCVCAHELASHQVRNRATVCGNIVNASPCADMAPALLCLDAQVHIASSSGSRILPVKEFFTGPKKTVLKAGEWLEKIIVPETSKNSKGNYLKLKRIAGHDLGIVGVLMVKRQNELCFAVSSAAPTPVLIDSVSASDNAETAIRKVLAGVSPISDVRATKEYREYMIGVYVKRLMEAGV